MNILHRRNRHHRLIDALNPDKGKRHYWGNLNGDYGFMESADRKQIMMNRLRSTKTNKIMHHRRTLTQQDTANPE